LATSWKRSTSTRFRALLLTSTGMPVQRPSTTAHLAYVCIGAIGGARLPLDDQLIEGVGVAKAVRTAGA